MSKELTTLDWAYKLKELAFREHADDCRELEYFLDGDGCPCGAIEHNKEVNWVFRQLLHTLKHGRNNNE